MSGKKRPSRTMILTRRGPTQKSRVIHKPRTPEGGGGGRATRSSEMEMTIIIYKYLSSIMIITILGFGPTSNEYHLFPL